MPTKTKTRNRRDLDAEITGRILEGIRSGDVPPWRRPWSTAGLMPTSATTGKPYRGINSLLLALAGDLNGYGSPYWLTYRQAKTFGGNVRRGEKGTTVVFFKRYTVADPDADDGTRSVRVMRAYTVFNLEQTDGVTMPPRFELEAREPVAVLPAVDATLAGYIDPPAVDHAGGARAYYDSSADRISLPALEAFETPEGFAETVLHELVHSTGHTSRLGRLERTAFGSAAYAREELCAEIGAAMLAGAVGIALDYGNATAYVKDWSKVLENDSSAIVSAALTAQRAVDRILGTTFDGSDDAGDAGGKVE